VLVLYYLFDKLWAIDLSLLFFAVLLISAYLFLCKWQFPKAGLRGILLMVGIGLVESLALIISLIVLN
jgi:CDP-diacylglycerol--serine O-phosphatidyltransferase